eukprot:gene26790-35117_t
MPSSWPTISLSTPTDSSTIDPTYTSEFPTSAPSAQLTISESPSVEVKTTFICQFALYCIADSDCMPGNKCVAVANYYSQCFPDISQYLPQSTGCISNYESECTDSTVCCDPGAVCNNKPYRQCSQPIPPYCATPSGYGNKSISDYTPSLSPAESPSAIPFETPVPIAPSELPTLKPSGSTSQPIPQTAVPSGTTLVFSSTVRVQGMSYSCSDLENDAVSRIVLAYGIAETMNTSLAYVAYAGCQEVVHKSKLLSASASTLDITTTSTVPLVDVESAPSTYDGLTKPLLNTSMLGDLFTGYIAALANVMGKSDAFPPSTTLVGSSVSEFDSTFVIYLSLNSSSAPIEEPTLDPTTSLSDPPNTLPSESPTKEPSQSPTGSPTIEVSSFQPSTSSPSTINPTTETPTSTAPTMSTEVPSFQPSTSSPSTSYPSTETPTIASTEAPTSTRTPSSNPSIAATELPSVAPTMSTEVPSFQPSTSSPSTSYPSTETPTIASTEAPTSTRTPSSNPSIAATELPSVAPTMSTEVPSFQPSTSSPSTSYPTTEIPTSTSTETPNSNPSIAATELPSLDPSMSTEVPSFQPSTSSPSTSNPTTETPTSASTEAPTSTRTPNSNPLSVAPTGASLSDPSSAPIQTATEIPTNITTSSTPDKTA